MSVDLGAFAAVGGPASKAREWPGDAVQIPDRSPNRTGDRVPIRLDGEDRFDQAMRLAGATIRKTERGYDVGLRNGSAEDDQTLAEVLTLIHEMSDLTAELDRQMGRIARLELKLADPDLVGDARRDSALDRLDELQQGYLATASRFRERASRIDRLLDAVDFDAAKVEVSSWSACWGPDDPVLRQARGDVYVWGYRWWRIALGLAAERKGETCPF